MISSEPDQLRQCRDLACKMALDAGFDICDAEDIASAAFEACVNAYTHGNSEGSDPATLRIRAYPDRLEVVVADCGPGIDGTPNQEVPSADASDGRGIPLMRAFMDEVSFESDDGFTVTMVKRLPSRG